MTCPRGERIIQVACGGIGRHVHVGRIEDGGYGLLPQVAVPRKVQVIQAERGHKRSVVHGDEVPVVAIVGIGGRQVFGVIVCGGCRRAIGVADKRTLEFVGDDTNFVATHVQQDIDSGVDADSVGRGDEFAVGGKSELVGAGDDPLRVGGGDIPAEPEDASAEFSSGVDLLRGVFGVEFSWMGAFAQLCGPLVVTDKEAPVIGGTDGVEQIEVRFRIRREVDMAAVIVTAGHDGGDAHVEVGTGLGLAIHTGEAIDEAGDDEFAGAVDDLGVGWCLDEEARAYLNDFAVLDDDDGVLLIECGAAPIGDVNDGAAEEDERRF